MGSEVGHLLGTDSSLSEVRVRGGLGEGGRPAGRRTERRGRLPGSWRVRH